MCTCMQLTRIDKHTQNNTALQLAHLRGCSDGNVDPLGVVLPLGEPNSQRAHQLP